MKQFFPLFHEHPEIVYLDNAATTQKPQMVIDGVSDFLKNEYANIHRGAYGLSEASELHYHNSKTLVAELLNCKAKEIIYTYNASYAVNLLAQALVKSKILQKGDAVLVGMRDHHANALPRMSLAEEIGFEVRFLGIDEEYMIDRMDFERQYDAKVKVVACGQVSNVSGAIMDLKKLKSQLRSDTFFLVDASQSVPNMPVDMQTLGCDALVFTGHKIMALTGIGVLALKEERIKALTPLIVWGGTIKDVSVDAFSLQRGFEKFEAWTPNIVWAVSLEYAFKFIASLSSEGTLKAGIQAINAHEAKLTQFALEQFASLKEEVQLIGPWNPKNRVALFSFILKNQNNFNQIGEFFAEKEICIRCGGHCAYPLHKSLNLGGTCRMSAYISNDLQDLEKFFERLREV